MARTQTRTARVVVHGGAGLWDGPTDQALAGCEEAARAGAGALHEGALEAAILAVKILETNPVFNAGLGSALTKAGTVELDAAVMTGDLRFGGVAACPPVESAIELARRVMEGCEHSLLSGAGAAAFALEAGVPLLDPEALITDLARQRWREAADRDAEGSHVFGTGTVGAVAVDADGNLVAATSTGGIVFKREGRIGDTPLPGAGTYADARLGGAVSATGHGEAIMRALVARVAVEALSSGASATGGSSPMEAASLAVAQLEERVAGKGGVIVIDNLGRYGVARNTEKMPWAECAQGAEPMSGS